MTCRRCRLKAERAGTDLEEAERQRRRDYQREYRARRIERDAERQRAYERLVQRRWREQNPTKARDKDRRSANARRARKAQVETDDHTRDDLAASWDERGLYGCTYCGRPHEHTDHFVPLSKGGAHTVENLVPSCAECNLSKKDRDPLSFLDGRGLLARWGHVLDGAGPTG